jgi:curved DNA-binding protein
MEYKDYYRILGVDKNATQTEIKRAYRGLARQYHPDIKPGDAMAETRFKEINEAYEVLGDPQKRAKYDRLGASWQQWQRAGQSPGSFDWSSFTSPGAGRVDFGDLFGGSGAGTFSDFFNALFGGMGSTRSRSASQRTSRGEDVTQPVSITLVEAFKGTTRVLERGGRRIRATIPPGAADGTKIRLSGLGVPAAATGRTGNLYLVISVADHDTFRRDGDDLHVEVPVDLYTAVLGGHVDVPTMDGHVRLRVPAGTQSGQVFRLRGRGMPRLRARSQHGDLYAKIMIQIPTRLSQEERGLFNQLLELQKR